MCRRKKDEKSHKSREMKGKQKNCIINVCSKGFEKR